MKRKLITFDWAIKCLLRSKANFGILEGFLSELLKEDISILEVLESEANKEQKQDKFNRVDLKVPNYPQASANSSNLPGMGGVRAAI